MAPRTVPAATGDAPHWPGSPVGARDPRKQSRWDPDAASSPGLRTPADPVGLRAGAGLRGSGRAFHGASLSALPWEGDLPQVWWSTGPTGARAAALPPVRAHSGQVRVHPMPRHRVACTDRGVGTHGGGTGEGFPRGAGDELLSGADSLWGIGGTSNRCRDPRGGTHGAGWLCGSPDPRRGAGPVACGSARRRGDSAPLVPGGLSRATRG